MAAANATGAVQSGPLRLQFDRSVKLAFQGSSISSDGGLLLHRELGDGLGVTDAAAGLIADPRTGRNGRRHLAGLLRQSIFSRLAGYKDVNDADLLRRDPVIRAPWSPRSSNMTIMPVDGDQCDRRRKTACCICEIALRTGDAKMSDKGRVALVTGGIQGLGAAASRDLAARGFRVAATHLGGGEQAEAFAQETGIPVWEWDVADFDACAEGVAKIEAALGPVEVLVNNAGVNRDVMFHKMSREDWDTVMRVDLGSMFNMCRQVIGGMRERGYGRIVNLSSVNARRGQAGQTNYCAAKAGVEGFTRALAREGATKGVTVNALAPGYAETPMVDSVPDEIVEQLMKLVPVGRLAQPEEIGRCVGFLASREAGFITGATLSVDGGLRMD